MLSLKNRTIAASAALVATMVSLAAATPINAAPIKVAYGDLNLNSSADVDTLGSRIRHAAREACDHGVRPVDAAACRSQTVTSAQSKVAMAAPAPVQLASR